MVLNEGIPKIDDKEAILRRVWHISYILERVNGRQSPRIDLRFLVDDLQTWQLQELDGGTNRDEEVSFIR